MNNFEISEDCILTLETKVYYLMELTFSPQTVGNILGITARKTALIYAEEKKKRERCAKLNTLNLGALNTILYNKKVKAQILTNVSDQDIVHYYQGKINLINELLEVLNG